MYFLILVANSLVFVPDVERFDMRPLLEIIYWCSFLIQRIKMTFLITCYLFYIWGTRSRPIYLGRS